MPKRVIDFDALWASDKIAACPAWAQAEYAWLYGLADASGCFELTNLRVIWGRVAAIRKELTLERLEDVFQEFVARGLLFTWEAGGKRYAHWTGSDVPGRLPPPSWRARLERLAPAVPKRELAQYMAKFSSRRELSFADDSRSHPHSEEPRPAPERHCDNSNREETDVPASAAEFDSGQLKLCLDVAQGQEWDKDWDWKEEEKGTHTEKKCASTSSSSGCEGNQRPEMSGGIDRKLSAEEMLEIYERERGSLPAAAGLTPERRRQCRLRIRAGLTEALFEATVRRAAATPFLSGAGARGWRANFDWFVANDTNVRKVMEGAYDIAHGECKWRPMDRALYSEIHVGTGPIASESGIRVKPEVIERIRAREAARRPP